jgi:hypothetical protein
MFPSHVRGNHHLSPLTTRDGIRDGDRGLENPALLELSLLSIKTNTLSLSFHPATPPRIITPLNRWRNWDSWSRCLTWDHIVSVGFLGQSSPYHPTLLSVLGSCGPAREHRLVALAPDHYPLRESCLPVLPQQAMKSSPIYSTGRGLCREDKTPELIQ